MKLKEVGGPFKISSFTIYICIYVYIYICTFTYIHTWNQPQTASCHVSCGLSDLQCLHKFCFVQNRLGRHMLECKWNRTNMIYKGYNSLLGKFIAIKMYWLKHAKVMPRNGKQLGQAPALSTRLWGEWLKFVGHTCGASLQVVLAFTGYFGLRPGEAVALKRKDLHVEGEVAKISVNGEECGAKHPGDVYIRKRHLNWARKLVRTGLTFEKKKRSTSMARARESWARKMIRMLQNFVYIQDIVFYRLACKNVCIKHVLNHYDDCDVAGHGRTGNLHHEAHGLC